MDRQFSTKVCLTQNNKNDFCFGCRTLVQRLTLRKRGFVLVVSVDFLYPAKNYWTECKETHLWLTSDQWSSVIWIMIHSEGLLLIHTWMTPGCGGSVWSPSTCYQTPHSPCPWTGVSWTKDLQRKSRWLCVFLADACWCYTAKLAINGNTRFIGRM